MSVTKQEIDDLDDLDDLLDDFDESAALATAESVDVSKLPANDAQDTHTSILPALGNDDFAKQLQSGMEELMKELDTSPEAKADFEQLMSQMNAATLDPTPAAKTSYPNNPSKKAASKTAKSDSTQPKNFQASIEANLQRMKASESKANEDSNAPLDEAESDAFMAEMMRQFQASSGGEPDGDFSKVLEGMMSQLMSKEILYEPLLELHQKYPAWIASNQADPKIKEYTEQSRIVSQIIDKFEDAGYRDEDQAKKAEVMDLMSRMQEIGNPPPIVSDDMGMFSGQADKDCTIM